MGIFSDVLLTVDYDRTLTAPDSTIPERNIEAIRYFTCAASQRAQRRSS